MSIDTLTHDLAIDDATADLLFREARTIREYSDAEVTDAQIAAVYDLVKMAPTAMNTQPLRLLSVRSPEARERLVPHMAEGNQARVSAAPLSLVVAYDPAFHRHMDTLFPQVPGMGDKFAEMPEVREEMARTNALLQAGYLILALRAAGLSTGPMNGMDFAGVDAEFFSENGWRSLLVVNVAVADGPGTPHPRTPRLDAAQAISTI
ncbi:malonic semialdehyde reductase [Paraoerskovia marina]|uniref:malonic semialdehyde reductase n=1 Tax=Paraoerskovia marina TaxID=545619 RepID=UPI00049287F6|nr:malonic semialdehyde reductase [Paraoerskovia marina]